MEINKKRNNRLKLFLIIFIGFIVFFIFLGITTFDTGNDYQHKIFTDINELDKITEFTAETIKNDNYLKDLVPVDSFSAKIKWHNNLFYVYAYKFESAADCMKYVKNRNMSYFDEESYHLSGNILSHNKYIVYSQNKVLYIEGPALKHLYDFLEFATKDFNNIID